MTNTTAQMMSLKEIALKHGKARVNGKIWRVSLDLFRDECNLNRDVKVKGHLQLGGFTMNHYRNVTITRSWDMLAEVVD